MAKARMCDKCGEFFEWNLRRADISKEYCSPTNKTLRGYAADGDFIPSVFFFQKSGFLCIFVKFM